MISIAYGYRGHTVSQPFSHFKYQKYRGSDKSLARPTSRCILFYGENISFDASLVICVNSTNIPPITFIQGGSNMTGTDLYVNKPHCAAAVHCGLFTHKSVPVIFEPPCK